MFADKKFSFDNYYNFNKWQITLIYKKCCEKFHED